MHRLFFLGALLLFGCSSNRSAFVEGGTLDGNPSSDRGSEDRQDRQRLPDASRSWPLEGHWKAEQIGDCIDTEEWWSFGDGGGFAHTFVNRDACYPGGRGVALGRGTFETLPEDVLSVTWTSDDTVVSCTRTVAVIDGTGTRNLHLAAYSRSPGGRSWHRVAHDIQSGPGDFHLDTKTTVDVAFDVPLSADTPSGSYQASVTITVVVTSNDEGLFDQRAKEVFVLPCNVVNTPDIRWLQIGAQWSELLHERGIYDRYPAAVGAALYRGFASRMIFAPREDRLFHGHQLRETSGTPPSSV